MDPPCFVSRPSSASNAADNVRTTTLIAADCIRNRGDATVRDCRNGRSLPRHECELERDRAASGVRDASLAEAGGHGALPNDRGMRVCRGRLPPESERIMAGSDRLLRRFRLERSGFGAAGFDRGIGTGRRIARPAFRAASRDRIGPTFSPSNGSVGLRPCEKRGCGSRSPALRSGLRACTVRRFRRAAGRAAPGRRARGRNGRAASRPRSRESRASLRVPFDRPLGRAQGRERSGFPCRRRVRSLAPPDGADSSGRGESGILASRSAGTASTASRGRPRQTRKEGNR